MVSSYNRFTVRNPASSIIISTGVIMTAGDILMQLIQKRNLTSNSSSSSSQNIADAATTFANNSTQPKGGQSKVGSNNILNSIDFRRAAHMGLYGLAILGPFSFYWYSMILPRLAPVRNCMHNAKKQIFKKIVIDQLIGSSVQYSTFLLAMTIFQGKSLQENPAKIQQDFVRCYVSDMCVWPWMQYFNFKYVPIHSQALVVNILNVFWNAYISNIHHSEYTTDQDHHDDHHHLLKFETNKNNTQHITTHEQILLAFI